VGHTGTVRAWVEALGNRRGRMDGWMRAGGGWWARAHGLTGSPW
jgi:hypothetical protein